MADAALMRLEAKRAKGPAGLLVPEDAPPVDAPQDPPTATGKKPDAPASSRQATSAVAKIIPEKSPAKPAPEKPNEVAARLEMALRGHLESVASALASTRAEQPAPETPAANGRSIYAPDRASLAAKGDDLRLPLVAPLDLEPLPPLPAALSRGERPADGRDRAEDEFGHASLAWLEEDAEEEEEPLPDAPQDLDEAYDDDEPLPEVLRRAWRQPEPVAHLPPITEPHGISARTLAVAALFGLAAGIGGIATYQFTVAPSATPVVAVAPNRPPSVDSTRIVKLDADRVPQTAGEPGIKLAAAAGGLARSATPAEQPAPAVAVADAAVPKPAPLASASPSVADSSEPVAPTLRKTADPAAEPAPGEVAAADEPADTEPFVATVGVRPAAPKAPSADPQVLAYAPTPKPNDPVARSFFGKGDDADPADPSKKSAKGAPAPSPGKAKVLMAVNMRSKPDNDAPSVKILGAGARVQVVQCDMWCTVIADGKRGYVFKKFLDN